MFAHSISNTNDDTFDDNFEQAVRKYQNFFKLPETGTLDANTVALMSQPRCGVPDFPRNHSSDSKSYYTGLLTYSFKPGTRGDVNRPIKYVTDLWANVTPKIRYQADIKISFEYRDHGDGSPFTSRILAHAALPTDARLHFNWEQIFDIQSVGLHELGHTLGLGHFTDRNAIMFPYQGIGTRSGLGEDDFKAILALIQRFLATILAQKSCSSELLDKTTGRPRKNINLKLQSWCGDEDMKSAAVEIKPTVDL
ncbi:hypothetical protein ACS0TY_009641 [Phlomoides rotata]